jgi:hypothetical protein
MNPENNGVEKPAEQSDGRMTSPALENVPDVGVRGPGLLSIAGLVAVEATLETGSRNSEVMKSIIELRTPSLAGYRATIDYLNRGHKKHHLGAAEAHQFSDELADFLTEDIIAKALTEIEADPKQSIILLATPNVAVGAGSIRDNVTKFAKNAIYEPIFHYPLYTQYSANKLSGTNPKNGKAIQFSLMFGKFTEGMTGTVEEQRAKLIELQIANPYLRPPSVLEAFTYWCTLRALGEQLVGEEIRDKTYIRHINLKEKEIAAENVVPATYIDINGGTNMGSSLASEPNNARLLMRLAA